MAQTWSYITQYGVVGRRDFGDCVRHGKAKICIIVIITIIADDVLCQVCDSRNSVVSRRFTVTAVPINRMQRD